MTAWNMKSCNILNNGPIFNLQKVLESSWSTLSASSVILPWAEMTTLFPFQPNLTAKSCDHPKSTNQEPWFPEISKYLADETCEISLKIFPPFKEQSC